MTRTRLRYAPSAATRSILRGVLWRTLCYLVVILGLLAPASSRTVLRVTALDWAMPGAVTRAFHNSQGALTSPKAAEVLRRWAQALGGLERLERIKNIYIRGRVETSGLSGLFEEWRTDSGRHKQSVELGEAYKQLTIFNRHTGWIVDQNGSVQELQGADLESEVTSAYLASFSYFFHGRMPGRIEYLGEDETKEAHVLNVLPQSGRPVMFYLDKRTYLPVKLERREAERVRTTYLSDWREVDGFKLPYELRQTVGDSANVLALTIHEVRQNVPLSPDEFEKPQTSLAHNRFISGRAAMGIPFDLGGNNHIFIQTRVNGSEPSWFTF